MRIKGKKIEEYSLDELSELSEDDLADVAGGWSVSVGGNINANGGIVGPDQMLDIQRIDKMGQVDVARTQKVRNSFKSRWRR